ncbi:MAG: PDZ domain-containing protein, partial [Thermoproteota archaeon]|nr:PDZ domain-containing protein [Thermoproteota archaeon]
VTIDGRPVVLGGDVIIAVDNIPIQNAQDIGAQLVPKSIGDIIEFTVIRGNSSEEIEVELGAR